MWIFHGPSGEAMSIKRNGVRYYLVKNLQGDVVAITGSDGAVIAQYTYDAWGKPLTVTDASGNDISANTSHIANINPLRYRGYYYDAETGLYYLLARYYDPVTGRFVNADGQLNTNSLLGYNLFAYCENNPVNYLDRDGQSAEHALGWMSSMWWLVTVDGPIPVGDIIYAGGIAVSWIFLQTIQTVPMREVPLLLDSDKDNRLYGNPGDINVEGDKETHIGDDGRADAERHHTDHGNSKHHTNPHDHRITWGNDGKPHFGPPKNYPFGHIPELK